MDFTQNDQAANDANNFNKNFTELFSRTSDDIQKLLRQNQPDKALEKFMTFIWTANSYAQTTATIINKLIGIIDKLKLPLENIAQKVKAASFSIAISTPIGISISVTWDV